MMEVVANFIQVIKTVFQEFGYDLHETDSNCNDRLKKFFFDYNKWKYDSTKDHHKYMHMLLYSLYSDFAKFTASTASTPTPTSTSV